MRWVLCLLFVTGCIGPSKLVWKGESAKPRHRKWFPLRENYPDEPPFLNGWPTHDCIAFEGDSLAPWFSPMEAQARAFNIERYREIFSGAEREEFEKRLADLKAAVGGDILRIPEILPAVEASPAFNVNIAAVCGDGWKGIRNVCMYVQDNCLIENGRLFYSLQGLSNDERYWIAGYWPVEAESLNYASRDLTAGQIDTLSSYTLYHDYLIEKLDYLERAKYEPALGALDDTFGALKIRDKHD